MLEPLPPQLPSEPAPFPVLWGDGPRCSIRRRWFQLLRSQTVMLPSAPLQPEEGSRQTARETNPLSTCALASRWNAAFPPVTLAPPLLRRLPSLFTAFLPPLRTSLAWHSWLLRNILPGCSSGDVPADLRTKVKGHLQSHAFLAVVTDKRCGMPAYHARFRQTVCKGRLLLLCERLELPSLNFNALSGTFLLFLTPPSACSSFSPHALFCLPPFSL